MSVNTAAAQSPLFQLGYVPHNVEEALDYWTSAMRIGPFFKVPHVPYDSVTYRGAPTTIDCSLYIAYWGAIQIELVEQHCDSLSLYAESLRAGEQGLHHICYTVEDIDVARQSSLAAGGKIVQELFFANGGGIYVDFGAGPGTIVEILQAPPEGKAMFDMMQAAAADWDGTEPLRVLGGPDDQPAR
jgi:methylmalonyl-CoA/ethylmalonyl-CoA epimerase